MLLKLVMSVVYEVLEKARVFVTGKPFHPSLMFDRKAGADQNRAPTRSSFAGSAGVYPIVIPYG